NVTGVQACALPIGLKLSHTRSELVSQKAIRTASNKMATRNLLAEQDIPAVRSAIIKTADLKTIQSKTNEFNFPIRISMLASSSKNTRTATADNREEESE